LADHLASDDIERGKKGGGTVPLVVVRHRAAAASLERQSRLGASSAWIWLFSSTENTTAWSGGSR
jgi:hypothetical protein